jgi:hypothetical protein
MSANADLSSRIARAASLIGASALTVAGSWAMTSATVMAIKDLLGFVFLGGVKVGYPWWLHLKRGLPAPEPGSQRPWTGSRRRH